MDDQYDTQDQPQGAHPHPYLHEPLLYISNLPVHVSDESLAMALVTCGPFRPNILRDDNSSVVSGTIEFKFLEKAEKALATLQSRPVPGITPPVYLVLSPYPPTNPPTPLPPPSALPRLVKYLPLGYTDTQLYDIFRPFGALASAKVQTHFGPDTGIVEFWSEEDAQHAEASMHCADVEGQNIAVQVYQPRRTSGTMSEFNATAPSFVPSTAVYSPFTPPNQYSPPRQTYSPRSISGTIPQFIHGPGQQVQLAPLTGPGSGSHSGLIDPCNLFCKNLDPEIDSNGLFTYFRPYGQIVSARVMRNEMGESRGFGFVSFQTPDQAAAAMHAMNGVTIGSKQIVVRLHEPKQLRQEKLAARFGGHPRNSSGATSPTASEGGDSYQGWGSPRHHPGSLSPVGSHHERPERGRRGSGSYYNAALTGTLNLPMRYDELSGLSPVVRKEVLTGELSRRIKTMDIVPSDDIETIVDRLVSVSLSEILQTIDDPDKLTDQVYSISKSLHPSESPDKSQPPSRSASASQDSRLLDPSALAATASAPEHPSTPISVDASLSTPPRTSSPSGSVPPISERDRMMSMVNKLESTKQAELTDLLMSLPKRERAMCLFNVEVLRAKLVDAKMVLESGDDDEGKASQSTRDVLATPQGKKTSTISNDSPQTPELSSRGPSATASPLPGTPSTTNAGLGSTHTVASLAKLPALDIIKLLSGPSSAGIPVSRADPLAVEAIDKFMDGLALMSEQQQKQELGVKLHKLIKTLGFKKSNKITIALLDKEDLRSVAQLMNYPDVLREKALLIPLGG